MYSCNAAKREHPLPTSLYKREVHGETFILLFRFLKMNKANHFLVFSFSCLFFILERGMRTPSLEKNKSVLTNL